MGRLTECKDRYCFTACAGEREKIREDCSFYEICYERQLYDKLAHYEDLEEQGRLIELPCALNSKLYFFGEKTDGTKVVDSITLSTYDHCINIGQHIGHGFYLTKEEAEAKLKELEGDKE